MSRLLAPDTAAPHQRAMHAGIAAEHLILHARFEQGYHTLYCSHALVDWLRVPASVQIERYGRAMLIHCNCAWWLRN